MLLPPATQLPSNNIWFHGKHGGMAPWFTAAHMQQLRQKQHGSQSAHCLGSAGLGATPDADSFLSGSWKVVPGGGGPPSTNEASHFLTSAWLLQFSGWLASNGACCSAHLTEFTVHNLKEK